MSCARVSDGSYSMFVSWHIFCRFGLVWGCRILEVAGGIVNVGVASPARGANGSDVGIVMEKEEGMWLLRSVVLRCNFDYIYF